MFKVTHSAFVTSLLPGYSQMESNSITLKRIVMDQTPKTMAGGDFTQNEYDQTFKLAAGLLDAYVDTLDSFVGKAAATIAVTSGRQVAETLCTAPDEKNCANGLAAMANAFSSQQVQIESRLEGNKAHLTLSNCPMKKICEANDKPLGSPICSMFHYYLTGIVAELGACSVRPASFEVGESCSLVVDHK